jgi:PAS domain S-box-containing protein
LDLDGRFVRINDRLAAINGLPAEAHIGRTVRDLLPGIADAAEELQRIVRESGEPVLHVEIVGETPAQPGARRVWEESWYPLRDSDGQLIGINVVAEEITKRKEAEERQLLLAREVDHRSKNALTMVQSVLRLTQEDDPIKFSKTVEGRIAALARAQGLLAEVRWSGVELRALLEAELAAFVPYNAVSERVPGIHMDGPSVVVRAPVVQPISMIVHELATNATKYGALSVAGGRVLLSWSIEAREEKLRINWAEQGGPPLATPPTRRGFGTRVINTLVERQLQGSVTRSWTPDGFHCAIVLPLNRSVMSEGVAAPGAPAASEAGWIAPQATS